MVIEECAIIVPKKIEPALSVADEPMIQNTLHAFVPFVSTSVEFTAVVNALPAWNTKIAFGSPPPSSVIVPVYCIVDPDTYTPGVMLAGRAVVLASVVAGPLAIPFA